MRVVPINEAEAIIESFWDGGSSEHPKDKMSQLKLYNINISSLCLGEVKQSWHSVEISIQRAELNKVAVVMTRDCNICIEGYDIFRVFAAVPSWVSMTIRVDIDGKNQVILNDIVGVDQFSEIDGFISGNHMSKITMEFKLIQQRPANIDFHWLGLSNKLTQEKMEGKKSPFTPEWPGFLIAGPEEYKPEIGIFFDEEGLQDIRCKINREPYKTIFNELKQKAFEGLEYEPEADIDTFVPLQDRRWCRDRDMKRKPTADVMILLAFVGLIEENIEMLTMAARMSISIAHCTYWCESIMGVLDGATWHHRSFTEEKYCRACALVLDWAGACITPHGKQVIRDAIIMKGLPRIESDFKRIEYIRKMNQGIVFSSGRIIGLLSLLPAYPRYKGMIEEAERDLHEMIDSYVHNDGGTLEGAGYWNYTFSQAIHLVYALSRFHNKTINEYATPSISKTGDFALSMLSITGDGNTFLPINDCHSNTMINLGVTAAYCDITENQEWKSIYSSLKQSDKIDADVFNLIFAPLDEYEICPIVKPKFSGLKEVGQVSSIRKSDQLGYVHFHLCSGPTDRGHFHQDKGSFILEVNNEILATDRGVTSYDNVDTALMAEACYHNLLYPESSDGKFIKQPYNVYGGKLTSAIDENGIIMLASNNKEAWSPGLFDTNIRRIFSPTPDIFIFDDVIKMGENRQMSFRINTIYPISINNGYYRIKGEKTDLLVKPLNWNPIDIKILEQGTDDKNKPVNILALLTENEKNHHLLTAIQVIPGGTLIENLWDIDTTDDIKLTKGDEEIILSCTEKSDIHVGFNTKVKSFVARCEDNEWIYK